MEKKNPSELVEEKFESLPSVVQEVIRSPLVGNKVDEIIEKYRLTDDQGYALVDETAYVLFGETPLLKFKNEVAESLGIDEQTALSISSEIYGSVFAPIKKFLRDADDTSERTLPVKTQNEEALSHHEILSEIENPTPSITSSPMAPEARQPEEKPVEREARAIEVMPQAIASVDPEKEEKTDAPTLEEAVAGIPNLGGFKPHTESTHPAQKVADKLGQNMTEKTSSVPTEIYQVKKPDPYKEPIV